MNRQKSWSDCWESPNESTSRRRTKGKIYSVHAEEVECISKGKEHKRYEFGCKVRVATTSKRGWVVGIDAEHGNPYDEHTLKRTTEQIENLTGVKPEQAFVDRGYRGKEHHPEGVEVYPVIPVCDKDLRAGYFKGDYWLISVLIAKGASLIKG